MKLPRSFYQKPALDIVKGFFGKYLVHKTSQGLISGKIIEVEAYPAFTDEVSHANKRTKRTEVIWGPGGFVYVYLIYGIHHQFGIVVNKKNIPEVVFIRAVIPEEGIEKMTQNFGREVKNIKELTRSPGNLCKSFGITLDLYGEDLTGDKIWIEDRGIRVSSEEIKSDVRVGINKNLRGSRERFRYYIK